MHNFCTLTSKFHIGFTLSLISKISKPIFILALDNFSYTFFRKYKDKKIKIFNIHDLKIISTIKLVNKRSHLEFIFTLKPIFIFFFIKKIYKKKQFYHLFR